MYHIYYDSNSRELAAYVVLKLYRGVVNFCWAPTITTLKYPIWTAVDTAYECSSIKSFLAHYTQASDANFTRIISFKSFADLPSLLPEHFI